MIFSRNRGGSGRHAARRRERDEFGLPEDDGSDTATARDGGPYDITEAPAGVERLDLGSLQIPVSPGVELRVQADPDGQIQQVLLVSGESALQVGVFAAPRSEGIWDEIRADIGKQLFSDGVAAEEAQGEYGTELRARVRTPDGLTDIRFVGVDGPRWMLRAVYQGPAATDQAAAGPLAEAMRGIVVDRGGEAMPVREPLPLRLPREVAEQAEAQRLAQEAGAPDGSSDGAPPAPAEPPPPPRRAGAPPAVSGRKPSPRPRRG